jgi:hypothetical protein
MASTRQEGLFIYLFVLQERKIVFQFDSENEKWKIFWKLMKVISDERESKSNKTKQLSNLLKEQQQCKNEIDQVDCFFFCIKSGF